ncbi:MAG: 3-oxoacyl-ACP synthase [Bacteroidota bacterium]
MELIITSYCRLFNNKVIANDRLVFYQENIAKFAEFIKSVYKQEQISYPKFYKMDSVSKLGFIAAELVLKEANIVKYRPGKVGVVLCNSSSSLDTDIAHNETIIDRAGYFPSPSVFVYTLPNIVIGEICIKNQIKGENAFLISETFDGTLMCRYIGELFENDRVEACLCGWIEMMGNSYNALMVLVEKADLPLNNGVPSFSGLPFTSKNLNLLMSQN